MLALHYGPKLIFINLSELMRLVPLGVDKAQQKAPNNVKKYYKKRISSGNFKRINFEPQPT